MLVVAFSLTNWAVCFKYSVVPISLGFSFKPTALYPYLKLWRWCFFSNIWIISRTSVYRVVQCSRRLSYMFSAVLFFMNMAFWNPVLALTIYSTGLWFSHIKSIESSLWNDIFSFGIGFVNLNGDIEKSVHFSQVFIMESNSFPTFSISLER